MRRSLPEQERGPPHARRALLERHDPRGVPLRLVAGLRCEDDGAAGRRRPRELPEALARALVERGGGLVCEQQVRLAEQREREVQPLALPDREDAARAVVVAQPEPGEQCRRPSREGPSRRPAARRARRSRAASAARSGPRAAAPSRPSPPGARSTRPPLGGQRAGEQREQRRLARAVRPDQRDDVAGAHLEVGRVEGDVVAVPARHPARREQDGQRCAAAGGSCAGCTGAGGRAAGAASASGSTSTGIATRRPSTARRRPGRRRTPRAPASPRAAAARRRCRAARRSRRPRAARR